MNLEKYSDDFRDFIVTYGPKLIGAILVLIIGWWVISLVNKFASKQLDKSNIETTLVTFFKSLINVVLKVLLFITVAGMMGIEMTSFIALLGAAGLAFGMALSGTLQNFAGGVMILIFKPFKVGDYIKAQGHEGTVDKIQIFHTTLRTIDNQIVVIPNGKLGNESLVNVTTEDKRRVDFTFGIGYGDDVQKARNILIELINNDDRIDKDPAPAIRLIKLDDSSVNLTVRVWCDTPDYWDIFFDMNEKVYDAFNEQGINIPFPQMDVHVQQN